MHDGEPHSAAPLTWLAAAFVAASSTAIVQIGSDARWLAAIGAIIARARAIPDAVAYAALPSDGWHDAPALGQLAFHGLESLLGDKGLVLAQIAAVTVAVGCSRSICAARMRVTARLPASCWRSSWRRPQPSSS